MEVDDEPHPTEDNLDDIMEAKYVPDIVDNCGIGTSTDPDIRVIDR